ncbi:MAG: GTP-binding protein [Methanophagales archaeon ANME-1-THS]|nr:MAG: GTP-binding protein [Methanophagales archaeon ANME-1-THS]
MEEGRRLRRRRKGLLSRLIRSLFFRKATARIGIYGPPNAGKTTLANRIVHTFVDEHEDIGIVSQVPHETRRTMMREGILIDLKAKLQLNPYPTENPHPPSNPYPKAREARAKLKIDIVDTPGLATKIDFHDFLAYGLDEAEAKKRAKEATEGVIEAIKWLDDVDGVLLLMDATEDPYTQTNIVIIGNLEARGIPVLIAANKIDLTDAAPQRIIDAFPQHTVIPISALKGEHMEELYEEMARKFR